MAFNPARFADGRPGRGQGLFLNLALWLIFGPVAAVKAEEAMFAPPARAAAASEASVSAQALIIAPAARPAGPASSGMFSPEMMVDGPAQKTLAGHGGDKSEDGESRPKPLTAQRDQVEKPYWLVEARRAERPYFQAEEKAPELLPYWLEGEDRDERPYWLNREPARESARPYWEPRPERVEIIAHTVEPAVSSPPPAPEAAGAPQTVTYFMYQDESGVRHLSNAPNDPRYREFTVTIDVKVQRGLARTGQARFTHESLRPIILRAARAYNLDPALIAAVIKSESAFDAHAVSWAGAQGLMQLMPGTAREMGCADPFDPVQNIMAGSQYLRLMLDTFGGNLNLALASYNSGPERVKRHWRVPNIPETRNYVLIVSRNYERYKGQL